MLSSHYSKRKSCVYVIGVGDETWGNPQRLYSAGRDVFVAKLDSSGNLLWSTFLGGGGWDLAGGIEFKNGNVYVSGKSDASWGSPINAYVSGNDGFFASLNADTGILNWHTFFGGSGEDLAFSVTTDANGDSYVSGSSSATWGNPVRAYAAGTSDALVVKFDSAGTLLWNTFLGGNGSEVIYKVDASNTGALYSAGKSTEAWGDPINAYAGGSQDGFIARLDPTSGVLAWHSFVGGSGADYAWDVDVNGSNIHAVGASTAAWGSPFRAYTGDYDAFYVNLNSSGGLLANAFLGGSGLDKSYGLIADENGNAFIAGYSSATWDTPIRLYTGDNDAFVAKVNNSTAPLIVSSVVRASSNPTNAASVDFMVTFSELVTEVDASDFTLTTTGVSGAAVSGVSGSGNTYTVTVNTGSGEGTIHLNVVDDDTIKNAALDSLGGTGLGNGDFILGQDYAVDRTPTVLSSTRVNPDPTDLASVNFTVTFSEAVTNVDAGDFTLTTTGVTGAAVSGVSGSGSVYTVTVNTGSGNGTIRLNVIDNDSILDAGLAPLGGAGANNGNFTTGEVYTVDKSMTFTSTASQDGWIIESAETSGVGGAMNNSSATLMIGDSPVNKQYRAILSFNTSTLPNNAVITSVKLKFKYAGVTGTLPFDTHGNLHADIRKGPFNGVAALEIDDFDAVASLDKVVTFINNPVNDWYTKSFNSANFQYINLGGVTQFRLRFNTDDNNDLSADYLSIYSGNATNAADYPQLIIEYYVP